LFHRVNCLLQVFGRGFGFHQTSSSTVAHSVPERVRRIDANPRC
jgi:hypothetical protein